MQEQSRAEQSRADARAEQMQEQSRADAKAEPRAMLCLKIGAHRGRFRFSDF